MRPRRGRLPRRRETSSAFGAQDNRRKRFENRARNGGRESGFRLNRFRSRRQGATVVNRSFGDPRSGRAALVTMEGARVILALHACFERRLPAGTQTRCALREREHANNRRHPFQDRPHTLGCVVAVGVSNIAGRRPLSQGLPDFRRRSLREIQQHLAKVRSVHRRKPGRGHKLCGFG